MSENVWASTSRNPKDLHGLYRDNFTFFFTFKIYEIRGFQGLEMSMKIACVLDRLRVVW
jgi:hypothetical protein